MKICVVGTGYVGLVAGACFAHTGIQVTCIDNNHEKIKSLREGKIPIFEPGLKEIIQSCAEKKRLHFGTSLAEVINESDVIFIAVGTPQDKDGSAQMHAVFAVCEELAALAQKSLVVGVKSTVPVGTGDKIEQIFKNKTKFPCKIFSNPEFLKEGDAVNDFMKPDRIILGINDPDISPILEDLYAPFMCQPNRLIIMNRKSAEVTKYAANAMLALRISFMNEMANFCDAVGANINDVRTGIGSDPRIGSAFLNPGLGYGGSCFPKDVLALSRTAGEAGTPMLLMSACHAVNEQQPIIFFKKIEKSFGGSQNLAGKKIAVWGAAFKANTDDIRESPALKIINLLVAANVRVHLSDPEALRHIKLLYADKLSYHEDNMEALQDADALVIGTDWSEFKNPDFGEIKRKMKNPRIFDGKNIYDSEMMKCLDIEYFGIGND